MKLSRAYTQNVETLGNQEIRDIISLFCPTYSQLINRVAIVPNAQKVFFEERKITKSGIDLRDAIDSALERDIDARTKALAKLLIEKGSEDGIPFLTSIIRSVMNPTVYDTTGTGGEHKHLYVLGEDMEDPDTSGNNMVKIVKGTDIVLRFDREGRTRCIPLGDEELKYPVTLEDLATLDIERIFDGHDDAMDLFFQQQALMQRMRNRRKNPKSDAHRQEVVSYDIINPNVSNSESRIILYTTLLPETVRNNLVRKPLKLVPRTQEDAAQVKKRHLITAPEYLDATFSVCRKEVCDQLPKDIVNWYLNRRMVVYDKEKEKYVPAYTMNCHHTEFIFWSGDIGESACNAARTYIDRPLHSYIHTDADLTIDSITKTLRNYGVEQLLSKPGGGELRDFLGANPEVVEEILANARNINGNPLVAINKENQLSIKVIHPVQPICALPLLDLKQQLKRPVRISGKKGGKVWDKPDFGKAFG